jgi:restriction system protein
MSFRDKDLILPTLRAVERLGGSAKAREITAQIIEDLGITDDTLGVMYDKRPETSIVVDRMDWARSYAKLGGVLKSPRRGLFLLSPLGREILALPETEADERCVKMDREVRQAARQARKRTNRVDDKAAEAKGPNGSGVIDEDDDAWKEAVPSASSQALIGRVRGVRHLPASRVRIRTPACRRFR